MDYQFCFPLKLNLSHRDYLKSVLLVLHLISLKMVFLSLGMSAGLIGIGVSAVSVKYYFEQQKTISEYEVLYGIGIEEWCLGNASGKASKVKMVSLMMFGPVLILKIKHHGDPIGWITCAVHQTAEDWHKIRILNGR